LRDSEEDGIKINFENTLFLMWQVKLT